MPKHIDMVCSAMRPDLRLFRYAVAVADEAGFGRAAAKLGMSQPPLSQRIAELETSLGIRLFDRSAAGAVPTAAGLVFLDQARIALCEAERAIEMATLAKRGAVGKLTLAVAGGAMFSFLPGLLGAYRARHPEIGLTILNLLSPDEQIAQIADGRIDAGLTRIAPVPAVVSLMLVHSEPFVLALPACRCPSETADVDLRDFAQDPFILFPHQGSGFHQEVVSLCLAAGFAPRIAQEIAPMHAVIGLVGAGMGLAVVPASAAVLAFPGVVYRTLREPVFESRLYLATHRQRQSDVCVAFLRFAMEYLAPRPSGAASTHMISKPARLSPLA